MANKITKPSFLPWLMWITGTIFYAYQFFLQVSPNIMVKELMHDFAIETAGVGVLGSLFFYTYAITQIPIGIILDRFGARKLLTFAAITCAVGTILFANAHVFIFAAIGRLLIGLGASTTTVGCLVIAITWLPAELFALLTGLMLTIGMLGAIGGQFPLALLIKALNWRVAMMVLGIIGFIIAILLWLILRDPPKVTKIESLQEPQSLLGGLKYTLTNLQTWICAIQAGLLYTPTLVLGTAWGVSFFMLKFGVAKPLAASIVSAIFLGWIFGAPIVGFISDYFRRRKIFMLITTFLAGISLVAAIYFPSISIFTTGLLLFSCGFFSSGLVITFSVAREITPRFASGAAMGFMNGINMLGGALLPPIIGIILELYLENNFLGPKVYTIAGFETAFTILPIILLIAFLLTFFIKETYAKTFAEK